MSTLERPILTLDVGQYVTIGRPMLGEVSDILQTHQEAFVYGYINDDEPELGATEEALQDFVHGRDFMGRRWRYYHRLTREPRLGFYVARLHKADGTTQVIGFGDGTVDKERSDTLEVTGMYVRPEWHRRGIGTALLQATLSDFTENTVTLDVTRWAKAAEFYAKCGFYATSNMVMPPEPSRTNPHHIILAQRQMRLDRQKVDKQNLTLCA
jgi:GNAT superfamily N-acetyltransferase